MGTHAFMEFGLAIGASYVLKKCRFNRIYCNPKMNIATHVSRDNLTVSHLKIANIQQEP